MCGEVVRAAQFPVFKWSNQNHSHFTFVVCLFRVEGYASVQQKVYSQVTLLNRNKKVFFDKVSRNYFIQVLSAP